jgi:energy-coupling factor transporter ATP-binding protein EcfA2
MLSIRDLKMSVAGRTLFENASLTVNYGDRVALVGPNGAGKSTLFSLILKRNVPDEGAIERGIGVGEEATADGRGVGGGGNEGGGSGWPRLGAEGAALGKISGAERCAGGARGCAK